MGGSLTSSKLLQRCFTHSPKFFTARGEGGDNYIIIRHALSQEVSHQTMRYTSTLGVHWKFERWQSLLLLGRYTNSDVWTSPSASGCHG